MMAKPLTAMPFYGGKTPAQPGGVGRWLIRHLPRTRGYAEPCAGMLGVLLNRPASWREIANDLDGRISNWWTTIREAPEDLDHRCAHTPPDRRAFAEARRVLDTPIPSGSPSVRHAWALWVVCRDSVVHGPDGGTFAHFITPDGGRKRYPAIHRLAARMRDVVVENRPAVEVLDRLARYDGWTVYMDPPYPTADGKPYGADIGDLSDLAAALRRQRGPVDVSGYAGDWPDLDDWTHIDFPARFVDGDGERTPRTERVWFRGFSPQPSLVESAPRA